MAGRGPAPKAPTSRRRRNKPAGGEWQPTPGAGWQHGEIPPPPDGLLEPSRIAWTTWMQAWFASHWTPADLPGLRKLVQLYDAMERGQLQRAAEVRQLMDTYGITPKGQQSLRWSPPQGEVEQPAGTPATKPSRYAHLRTVAG